MSTPDEELRAQRQWLRDHPDELVQVVLSCQLCGARVVSPTEGAPRLDLRKQLAWLEREGFPMFHEANDPDSRCLGFLEPIGMIRVSAETEETAPTAPTAKEEHQP